MKRLALLVILMIAAGCDSPRASVQYPVIVVDEEHNGFSRPDGSDPPEYSVSASPGLVLDASSYRVQIPPEFKVDGPNMIHVLAGEDRQYRTAWKSDLRTYVLDSGSLAPRTGMGSFCGFDPGDTAIVAIGFDHTGITPGKDNVFSVMWLGLVKFK